MTRRGNARRQWQGSVCMVAGDAGSGVYAGVRVYGTGTARVLVWSRLAFYGGRGRAHGLPIATTNP